MRHRPSQLLVVALLQLQSAPPPFLNFDFLFPSESLTCYMHRISIRHVGPDCKCGESQLQLLQYIKTALFLLADQEQGSTFISICRINCAGA